MQKRIRLALPVEFGSTNDSKAHALVEANSLPVLFVDIDGIRISPCEKLLSNACAPGAWCNEEHLNLSVGSSHKAEDTARLIRGDLQIHCSQILLANQRSQPLHILLGKELVSSAHRRLPYFSDLVEVIRRCSSNGAHGRIFSCHQKQIAAHSIQEGARRCRRHSAEPDNPKAKQATPGDELMKDMLRAQLDTYRKQVDNRQMSHAATEGLHRLRPSGTQSARFKSVLLGRAERREGRVQSFDRLLPQKLITREQGQATMSPSLSLQRSGTGAHCPHGR